MSHLRPCGLAGLGIAKTIFYDRTKFMLLVKPAHQCLCTTPTMAQKIGDYYVSISIDSIQGGRLKFLSDSTVELSSIPRHMSPSMKTAYKYKSTDSTVEILPDSVTSGIRPIQGLYPQPPTIKTKIILTKIDRGFIDYSKSLIYVRQKDFGYNPNITYLIGGKSYTQDMGETDSYGLIRKRPKTNKVLQRKLKSIDKENCTIEIVRGLNAYKRYGIEKVYGVIVITSKQ
jgi:hypothetical protein